MEIQVKVGTFKTKRYSLELENGSILMKGDGLPSIRLENNCINEIYIRFSDIKYPSFEFHTKTECIEGRLNDLADSDRFLIMMKREFGRKTIID